MHPIERLRYVARARGADAESLVRETAAALRGLGLDPPGLVVACRRIVGRHPTCGPLWWLCARLLTSPDPFAAARAALAEIEADPTVDVLTDELPDGATVATIGWPDLAGRALLRRGDVRVLAVDAQHQASSFVQRLDRAGVDCELVPTAAAAVAADVADLVLVEADAVCAERFVVPMGSAMLAAVAVAAAGAIPVWAVAGCGRRLPGPMVDAIVRRAAAEAGDPFDADAETVPAAAVTVVVGPGGRAPMGPGAVAPECELAPELLRCEPM